MATEPTRSIQQMTKAELRAPLDQRNEHDTALQASRKIAPVPALPAMGVEVRTVLALQRPFDTTLTERWQQQRLSPHEHKQQHGPDHKFEVSR